MNLKPKEHGTSDPDGKMDCRDEGREVKWGQGQTGPQRDLRLDPKCNGKWTVMPQGSSHTKVT